jgi:antitoxin ParD1/3/4
MDISLSPDNEKFLQSQIAAGIYNSINEAINATLSIAISQVEISPEDITNLRKDIAKGMDDIKNGRTHDCIEFMDGLIAKYD